jgi:hypothetical protein
VSGGSYDYASYEMETGRLDKALQYIVIASADLNRAASEAVKVYDHEDREVDGRKYRVATSRDATEAERVITEMALGALKLRMDAFCRLLAEAGKQAQEMAPLFHELEWWRSGDTGVESFMQWAREWATRKLNEAKGK